jgi:hypothetical protein
VDDPQNIRQNQPMIPNADLAAVQEKVFLRVNINYKTHLPKFVYRRYHFPPFPLQIQIFL